MTDLMRNEHFLTFKAVRQVGPWEGRDPVRFATGIGADKQVIDAIAQKLVGQSSQPNSANAVAARFSRTDLYSLAADREFGDEAFLWSVMAWGGMKYSHGRTLAGHIEAMIPILSALRAGHFSRRQAYDAFAGFRRSRTGCGLGPAYFTKLIFFGDPKHDGYIMDQWTARSINLLFPIANGELVTLIRSDGSCWVSDRNDSNTYEAFCTSIEHLAAELNEPPDLVEAGLFSWGGRNRMKAGPWRIHVKAHG